MLNGIRLDNDSLVRFRQFRNGKKHLDEQLLIVRENFERELKILNFEIGTAAQGFDFSFKAFGYRYVLTFTNVIIKTTSTNELLFGKISLFKISNNSVIERDKNLTEKLLTSLFIDISGNIDQDYLEPGFQIDPIQDALNHFIEHIVLDLKELR